MSKPVAFVRQGAAERVELAPAHEELSRDLALLSRAPETRISRDLLTAYAAAAAPNSLRAFRSDVLGFDAWCRARAEQAVPARPEAIAAFLMDRVGEGAAPATLAGSVAKIGGSQR